MGKQKVLYYVEVEDDYKGILAIVDEDHFGNEDYKKKVRDLLADALYLDEEEDEDNIEDFDKMVDKVARGEDSCWLDYNVCYTDELPVL